MKKFTAVLLLICALAVSLSSCGLGRVKIEEHEWRMRYIFHAEGGEVVIDAVDKENPSHPEAKIIDMSLVAEDGRITLTDRTNNKTYVGTYTVSGKNPEGTDYKITLNGKSGHATAAMTTFADGKEEPTLPITLGGYSMYFYAE